jgi:hypothetical protein
MAEEEKNQAEVEESRAGTSDEVAEEAAEPAAPPEPEPAGNVGEAEASGGVIPDAKSDAEPAE